MFTMLALGTVARPGYWEYVFQRYQLPIILGGLTRF